MQFKVLSSLLLILALSANKVQAQPLKGAGAPSTYPLLRKWFSVYAKQTKNAIDYMPLGVGSGMRQLKEDQSNFAVIESPPEKNDSLSVPIRKIPLADENIAIIYNLPELKKPLKISGPILDCIMRGKISRWNDPRLQKLNIGNPLPNRPMFLVKRSTRSGVNWAMTRYLSESNRKWRVTSYPQWEIGIGGKGCDGISNLVKSAEGAFGFVELSYAKQNRIQCAEVENNGKFYRPTSSNYPIWTQHFLLWKSDSQRAKDIASFARWALKDGQKFTAGIDFMPVSTERRQKALAALD